MPHAAGLYYEWRGPENGKVLILSSGLGGSASYWDPNLEALGEQYRLLLYDHRGTGRSERALPDEVSIDTMTDDLLALLAELGIVSRNANFVGHAIGGLIGLEIALRQGLAKLVIVNGWARIDPHTERCFDTRIHLLRDSGPEAFVRAQPIFLFPANWIATHEDELASQAAAQLEHFPGAANVEKRIAAARGFDLWVDMPDAKILVLAAADDILVPSLRSEALVKELNDEPKLATMDWGGHACNVTDPDAFNALVLEFLRS
jgi:aminoacrylate hydrolase